MSDADYIYIVCLLSVYVYVDVHVLLYPKGFYMPLYIISEAHW